MLFNSYEFIFLFLPLTLGAFYCIPAHRTQALNALLLVMSLVFYAWWSVAALWLMLGSVVANYLGGQLIARRAERHDGITGRQVLWFMVLLNLGLIAYFKYFNFFIETATTLTGETFVRREIILPIGISFYTFTQIAYLVDLYQRKTRSGGFVSYALFVTYFPHLIAGPILHHAEMLPQFEKHTQRQQWARNLALGLVMFGLGLFKKLWIADPIGGQADQVFGMASSGRALTTYDAWCGALAYTFQLYFDFSGYSDMAIGLSRMLGISLPVNFNSPYKATSIIEFWRRWHMTLSRFLRDYLYIALGGNRTGSVRKYANILVTMVLGGLWHGAAWTFVAWGAFHGALILVNHGFRAIRSRFALRNPLPRALAHPLSLALTFLLVVVGWVIFRADSMAAAVHMLRAMFLVGEAAPTLASLSNPALPCALLVLFAIVTLSPNSQELVQGIAEGAPASAATRWQFKPNLRWAVFTTFLLILGLLGISNDSAFLYFQF